MKGRVRLLLAVAATSLVASLIVMSLVERGTNPEVKTTFDVFWWWVVTSTTVGYGDIVPVTTAGRVMAIFTIVAGFYMFTSLIAIVAESTRAFVERRDTGRATIRFGNHLLMCEYTAMADELVQSLPMIPELAPFPVVIATDLVEHNPYPQHGFVRGVPINPAVLRQANCAGAAMVFIFANFRFADPDVKTLHIASRVRAQNPDAIVFVELVAPAGELMQYAPSDLVVLSSRKAMEYVLRKATVNPLEWIDPARRAEIVARLEAVRTAADG